MKITTEDIIHVGKLARLDLDEHAVKLYAKQLGDILDYVGTLNRLDTAGVEATSHAISIKNAVRDDDVKESMPVARALANAPEQENGSFVVPKVIR